MAGHSKWHNIKNRKAATDAKKAKVFSELAKKIRIAVKESGSGDVNSPGLKTLLEKARAANMPREKIQRAIDCGLGKGKGGMVSEIKYEIFGPGGAAMIAIVFTDNINRTGSEIKNILKQHAASLGSPGSVQYLFKREASGDFSPNMSFDISDLDKENLKKLIEALNEHEEVEDIYCNVVIS